MRWPQSPGWLPLGLLALGGVFLACSPTPGEPTQTRPLADATPKKVRSAAANSPDLATKQPLTATAVVETTPTLAAGKEIVRAPVRSLVLDPASLSILEQGSANLGALLHQTPSRTMAELASGPRMAAIERVLIQDFNDDASKDKRLGVGMRFSHRQFDRTWLRSPQTHVELIGVVNRLDRHPFAPEHCGETRLIYRLAYQTTLDGTSVRSRLPMTFNVVFWQDSDGDTETCADVASRWQIPESTAGADLATQLTATGGPLASKRLATTQLKSVEVNLQSVRWPAAVHPSMAGHAEYILRVFHPDGEGLRPAKLENTPDVARLKRDAGLRRELLDWLLAADQQQAIDQGTVVVPEKFLAERATSVTPRGFARLANRPYRQLFKPKEFSELSFAGQKHVKSPLGILRRLDGLTCNGCHESRSVAGFHLLGVPRDPNAVLDTLAVSTSPHLDGELARRATVFAAMAAQTPPDDTRPHAEAELAQGRPGSHCGLGDPSFADFRCDAGLRCTRLDDPEMGTCATSGGLAGTPCEVGSMAIRANPHADRVQGAKSLECRENAVCNRNKVGFPQGMCTASCSDLQPGERCGAIVSLHAFNLCIGQKKPFPGCITSTAHPAGMQACDTQNPCRDDYICARSPNAKGGVCLPPYFLFQMRVDGHVLAD